jgi:hypothetical protein
VGRVARARCWVLRDRACAFGCGTEPLDPFLVRPCVGGGGYRPYFENYTVDASILDSNPSGFGSQRSDFISKEVFRSLVNLQHFGAVDRF